MHNYTTRMSKTTSSEIKIAIVGAAATVVFTAIWDWIKQKPILTTLINILKWLWQNIFEFRFALWQILALLIIYKIIRTLIKKTVKETQTENKNEWLNYTEDDIDGIKWKWFWQKNALGKWNIENLRPICNKCGTSMKLHEIGSYDYADCPRCEKSISEFKSPNKVEDIIIDNVHRNLYLDKIK